MRLFIKPSKEMNAKVGEAFLLERKAIRMPQDFREFAGLSLGDFLDMRTASGGMVTLAIEKAYGSDVEEDSLSAYVTSEIHQLLTGVDSDGYEVELVDGITLGCDPELMLVDRQSKGLVTAAHFFTKWDPIGYDGLLMEFRPLPSTDENVVVANMFDMIKQARVKINRKKLRSVGPVMMTAVSAYKGMTAGFHLHYGLPPELLGWKKRALAAQMVKVMDYYVGIPSMMPERYDNHRRTVPYLEYGKPGNYRIDNRTLEYRVPGAALMAHPILARGILSLGAVVIEDVVSRIKAVTDNFTDLTVISADADIRELYPNIPPVMQIFTAICSPDISAALQLFSGIKADVGKMVGYARRVQYINEYFKCIDEGTEFSPDVEENWWRYYHGQRQSGQMDVLHSSI